MRFRKSWYKFCPTINESKNLKINTENTDWTEKDSSRGKIKKVGSRRVSNRPAFNSPLNDGPLATLHTAGRFGDKVPYKGGQ